MNVFFMDYKVYVFNQETFIQTLKKERLNASLKGVLRVARVF